MKLIIFLAFISLSFQIEQSDRFETFDELNFIKPELNSIAKLSELDSIEMKSILFKYSYEHMSTQDDLVTYGKNLFQDKFQTITFDKNGGYVSIYWQNTADKTLISPMVLPDLKSHYKKTIDKAKYYKVAINGIYYSISIEENIDDGITKVTNKDKYGKVTSEESYEMIIEKITIASYD